MSWLIIGSIGLLVLCACIGIMEIKPKMRSGRNRQSKNEVACRADTATRSAITHRRAITARRCHGEVAEIAAHGDGVAARAVR